MKHAAFFEGLWFFPIFLLPLASCLLPSHCRAEALQWECEWPGAKSQPFTLYHGETATFRPTFRINGVVDTNVTVTAVYIQTNGMGSAWWQLDNATFHPTNDVGAASYRFFVQAAGGRAAGASLPASEGILYRANGTLRMLESPGFTPSQIPFPVQTLDFAATTILNPPWPDDIEAATNAVLASAAELARQDIATATNRLARTVAEKADKIILEYTEPTLSDNPVTDVWRNMVTGEVLHWNYPYRRWESQSGDHLDYEGTFWVYWDYNGTGWDDWPIYKDSWFEDEDAAWEATVLDVGNIGYFYRYTETTNTVVYSDTLTSATNAVLSSAAELARQDIAAATNGLLRTETDPTVSAWAKASSKPSYSWSELLQSATMWVGAGNVLKFLAYGTSPTVGGVQIAWSSSNDNNLTSYFYNGIGVKRNGTNEDFLFDTASTNGIVRRKELDGYKPKQTAKSSPTASGNAAQFIDTISQDANGVITATKKSVRGATTSQTGVVQLNNTTNSTSTSQAATANAVKLVRDEVGAVAATVASLPTLSDVQDEILIHLTTTNAYISVSNGVERIYEVDGTNRTLKYEWNMGFAAITNTVNTLSAQMPRKIENASTWAEWAANGAANQFQGAVNLNMNVYFGSTNVTWAASNGFAVMTSHMPVSASGTAAQFRIGTDTDDWFGMEVTASYLVDASASGFSHEGTTSIISTPWKASYADADPRVYFTADLSEPFAQLSTGITWAHTGTNYVATITGQTGTSGFYFLKEEVPGGAVFRSTMPILPEGYRVENNGDHVGTLQPDSIITITSGGKTYQLFAQEVQ